MKSSISRKTKTLVLGVATTVLLSGGVILANQGSIETQSSLIAESELSTPQVQVAHINDDFDMTEVVRRSPAPTRGGYTSRTLKLSNKSKLVEVEESSEADVEEKKEDIEVLMSNEQVAKLTLNGDFGNGEERKKNIEAKGYNYEEVQKLVVEMAPKERPKVLPTTGNSNQSQVAVEAPVKNSRVIKAFPHNTFKSYMRWTALASNSPQGRLCASASKDPNTAIMKKDGRYLVALGFAYAGDIGEHIDIVMESGQVIPAIVGDWKAKGDTDANNSSSLNNGSIVEFIVSSNEEANRAVNGSGNYNTIFPGNVKEFRK